MFDRKRFLRKKYFFWLHTLFWWKKVFWLNKSFRGKKVFRQFFSAYKKKVNVFLLVATVTTVTSVSKVTTITITFSITTVKCIILLLIYCKGKFFTKSYKRPTDQPTTRLLELPVAAKNSTNCAARIQQKKNYTSKYWEHNMWSTKSSVPE